MAQTYTVSYNANGGYNAPSSAALLFTVTLTPFILCTIQIHHELWLVHKQLRNRGDLHLRSKLAYVSNAYPQLTRVVWKYKPATYTVGYDANGGTGAPGRQTKTYGVTLTLTTIQPTRRNYLFLGRSKDRNAIPASLPGGSYTDNR